MELNQAEFTEFFDGLKIQDLKVLTADYLTLFPDTPQPLKLLKERGLWEVSSKVISDVISFIPADKLENGNKKP